MTLPHRVSYHICDKTINEQYIFFSASQRFNLNTGFSNIVVVQKNTHGGINLNNIILQTVKKEGIHHLRPVVKIALYFICKKKYVLKKYVIFYSRIFKDVTILILVSRILLLQQAALVIFAKTCYFSCLINPGPLEQL